MKNFCNFALLLLVGVFSTGCMTRIAPGHVGIKIDLAGSNRGAENLPIRTGWIIYNPASSQVVEYPTFVQTAVWSHSVSEGHPVDEEITFTTKDSMVVSVDVNLSYSLLQERVPAFYVKFRSDDVDSFTHGFLRNVARDCFNETAGKYSVEQVMGDNAPFLLDARKCLQDRVAAIGVSIEQFGIIGAPRPPQGVINAINLKVQAQQIALQKQNEVMQAEADAKKQIATAQGQAESNRVLTQSITPQLVEWQKLAVTDRWISRWNGSMPQVSTGAQPGLLLNLEK